LNHIDVVMAASPSARNHGVIILASVAMNTPQSLLKITLVENTFNKSSHIFLSVHPMAVRPPSSRFVPLPAVEF
jgi:hypothetical protein